MNVNFEFYEPKKLREFLGPKKLREKITALVELHNVSQMNVHFLRFYEWENYVNYFIHVNAFT